MAGEMVRDAVVNIRAGSSTPYLELDGQPFPFLIDKAFGIQVEANDDNVHLVKVAIQVERSVSIIDHSADH